MCAGGNWAIRDFFVEQAGLWMRNPGNVIIRCEALVTSFGGLVLGCIEANFLQDLVLSYDSKYNFCGIQDFRTLHQVNFNCSQMLTTSSTKCWPRFVKFCNSKFHYTWSNVDQKLANRWQNIKNCWRRVDKIPTIVGAVFGNIWQVWQYVWQGWHIRLPDVSKTIWYNNFATICYNITFSFFLQSVITLTPHPQPRRG